MFTRLRIIFEPKSGGESGIRTHGSLTFNGFQDRRNRPLCHLSASYFTAPPLLGPTWTSLYGMQDHAETPKIDFDEAFQHHLRKVARYCESRLETVIGENRSVAELIGLVHHFYEVADYEISEIHGSEGHGGGAECDGGIPVTVPEAIAVAHYLAGTGVKALVSVDSDGSRCPFFVDGRCLVEDVRPLLNRFSGSRPGRPCLRAAPGKEPSLPELKKDAVLHAVEHGLRAGLRFEYLDADRVQLCAAVRALLESPGYGEEYLWGKASPERLAISLPGDPIKRLHVAEGAAPEFVPPERRGEPTGYLSSITEKSLREYYDLGLNHGHSGKRLPLSSWAPPPRK